MAYPTIVDIVMSDEAVIDKSVDLSNAISSQKRLKKQQLQSSIDNLTRAAVFLDLISSTIDEVTAVALLAAASTLMNDEVRLKAARIDARRRIAACSEQDAQVENRGAPATAADRDPSPPQEKKPSPADRPSNASTTADRLPSGPGLRTVINSSPRPTPTLTNVSAAPAVSSPGAPVSSNGAFAGGQPGMPQPQP
jgi:hypothetical protein